MGQLPTYKEVNESLSPKPKIILFLTANPQGTVRIRLDEEVRDVTEGLNQAKRRELFKVESVGAVRFQDVRRAILKYDSYIVHFSGHGKEDGTLILEGKNGKPELISPETLSGLFKLVADHVQCVVLNACYSKIQADRIAEYIDYVIGMDEAIDDQAAIDFAVGFYDAIGSGRSLEDAYHFGCNAASMTDNNKDLIALHKHSKYAIHSLSHQNFISESASLPKPSQSSPQLDKQSKLTTTPSITYEFIIGGSIKRSNRKKLEAIVVYLKNISGDANLTLLDVEEGSIKLILQGSEEGFQRLRSLIASGELSKVMGAPVQGINRLAAPNIEAEQLTLTPMKANSGLEFKIRIFLAHASEDKDSVTALYSRLKASGFDPWLDKMDLLPGQNWQAEIPKAIKDSDVFIACLSQQSVAKQGYVQREFRMALNAMANRPPGQIFLIPVRLDDCQIPELRQEEYGISLTDYQWVNLYESDGYERLIKGIEAGFINATKKSNPKSSAQTDYKKLLEKLGQIEERVAKQEAPKYDLRGAQFAGGFAETVHGNQIGKTFDNGISISSGEEAPNKTQQKLSFIGRLRHKKASLIALLGAALTTMTIATPMLVTKHTVTTKTLDGVWKGTLGPVEISFAVEEDQVRDIEIIYTYPESSCDGYSNVKVEGNTTNSTSITNNVFKVSPISAEYTTHNGRTSTGGNEIDIEGVFDLNNGSVSGILNFRPNQINFGTPCMTEKEGVKWNAKKT